MQINEFDHPDHGWKWRACELRWIEAKIAEAVVAEREACAAKCDELADAYGDNSAGRALSIAADKMRSNALSSAAAVGGRLRRTVRPEGQKGAP